MEEKVGGSWDREIVISELTQGRELANQLKIQLDPAKSLDASGFLVEKILSTYDNALSLLNFMASNPSTIPATSDEASHLIDSKDGARLKKRKISEKWSEQVHVMGREGHCDDGFSWRKYGQKDILGAKFPRAYYRCTHRHTQGCLATKHVQRRDEDPSIFEVTYRGRHSCIQDRVKQSNNKGACVHQAPKKNDAQPLNILLENETQELDGSKEENVHSFSFHSPPIESTSDSYLCWMNDFAVDQNLQTSDSDFTDIISSTPTSVTNSPFVDLDFPIEPVDFDPKILDAYF